MEESIELSVFSDEYFMKQALIQARQAFDEGEVPIGAVIVCENRIIGRGYNQVERLNDATAHAEMIAMTAASQTMGAKYLPDCTLYVTVEPCPMCAAGSKWVQMGRIVYGTEEPKHGFHSFGMKIFHPKTEVSGGLLAIEAADLMRSFFKDKRS